MAAVPRETGRALSALRNATRELHEAIEAQLPIARAGAGHAEYARHVAALYGWLSAIHDPGPHVEQKLGWLRTDIDMARADGFLRDPLDVMPAVHLPTRAEWMGWSYVIEGSMLGGRVLKERLGERLAPWPLRYLEGYGAETGRQWRRFLVALEENVANDEDIAAAVKGARAAFRSLGEWFDRLTITPVKR